MPNGMESAQNRQQPKWQRDAGVVVRVFWAVACERFVPEVRTESHFDPLPMQNRPSYFFPLRYVKIRVQPGPRATRIADETNHQDLKGARSRTNIDPSAIG